MTDRAGAGLPPPRKRFGQHFLADPRALDRIVEALQPQPESTIVEIGPGRGALTDRLVSRCRRLIAIEIDRDLVRHLQERYRGIASVEIVEGDALETDWGTLAGTEYLLAGNLPYYITTPLLFRVLATPRPDRAVLIVQREVAGRLLAAPGSDEYGALSVNVQASATVEVVARVSAGAFHPKPAVDSTIVMVRPLADPLVSAADEIPFRRFVQAVFGMRRKQLVRVVRELTGWDALRAGDLLSRLGVPGSARPETLSPEGFVRLHQALRDDLKLAN
ncbi:MAG TPA: 16S rRNA (adenine(1518)-N(6)/adenine(1519)-N(6))-dimethyltransferase RsmA [Gemmatimonadaceae bacterium]